MKQPSAAFPLEKILVFQRVICILLIALMLLSCRGSFFVVPFDDDFSDMYTELDSEDKEEFKDSVFVKFDFFGSSLAIFKLIYFANANGPELDNAYQEVMSISSGHSLAIRSNAIAFLIIEGFDSELFAGIYFSLLALTSITLPLHFLAAILIILYKYRAPTVKKDEQSIYRGTLNIFRLVLCRIPLLFLLITISPKVALGFSSVSFIVLACAGIIVNTLAPIFKDYTKAQRKYVITLQAVSLLGIINFAVFCVSLIRSHSVNKAVSLLDGKGVSQFFAMFEGGKMDMGEVLFSLAAIVFLFALFGVCRALSHNLCRLGLTTTRLKKHDYTSGDAYISTVIRPNFMLVVYLFLLNSQGQFIFYGNEGRYFATMMICTALMTGTEILITVLKETLCSDLGRGGRYLVLEGDTYHPEHVNTDTTEYTFLEKLQLGKIFKKK